MILVDTSVWIDLFRENNTYESVRLEQALNKNEDLCICGIIRTEILQGIQPEQEYEDTKSFLRPLIDLPMGYDAYLLAAEIHRRARSHGEIIRNTLDCLIAACAISHHAFLLQSDKDFVTIAKYSKLKLIC